MIGTECCMELLNHHIVYLKLIQLCVNYTGIKNNFKSCWLSSLYKFSFPLRPDKSKVIQKRQMTEVFSSGY